MSIFKYSVLAQSPKASAAYISKGILGTASALEAAPEAAPEAACIPFCFPTFVQVVLGGSYS